MSSSFDLSPVDRITVGTVGPTGKRTFYLQARQGSQLVTLKMEKQQVGALARLLGELLSDLPSVGTLPDHLDLEEPVLAEWAIGAIRVEYDSGADQIVLVAEGIELVDEEGIPVEEAGGLARFAATREQVARWLEILDPERRPGRLALIHRFGAGKIADALPTLIDHVRAEGGRVVWICDPMHGNTHSTASGVKTRSFEDIYAEVEQAFDIHTALGQTLGGVHIELTGENVTECVGGSRGPNEEDLARAYESEVDPRLNHEQSLELAFLIARKMKNGKR